MDLPSAGNGGDQDIQDKPISCHWNTSRSDVLDAPVYGSGRVRIGAIRHEPTGASLWARCRLFVRSGISPFPSTTREGSEVGRRAAEPARPPTSLCECGSEDVRTLWRFANDQYVKRGNAANWPRTSITASWALTSRLVEQRTCSFSLWVL